MQKLSNLAFISLGSNSGDSRAILAEALRRLAALPGVEIAAASACYCTEPQDDKNQPWFFNQAAALRTELAPLELLEGLQGVENALGRVREAGRRFGPRTLDLDILAYYEQGREEGAGVEISLTNLTLPHPRLWRRAFVLVPLLEIAADFSSDLNAKARAALEKLDYRLESNKIYQK